jgi:hypothetical protein
MTVLPNTLWKDKVTGRIVRVTKVYVHTWNRSSYVQMFNLTSKRSSAKRYDWFIKEFEEYHDRPTDDVSAGLPSSKG